MQILNTSTLYNCFSDSRNWGILQTARELLILESSLAIAPSPELQQKLDELKSQDLGLEMFSDFAREFLEACLDEGDRSIHPDDSPLVDILKHVNRVGCFIPDCDRKRIKSLGDYDQETVQAFCKSISYRGFAHWSGKYQALTKEAIGADPGDYDYAWLNP